MIIINDIKDIPAQLYCPDDKLIGTIENSLQLWDVCIQIKNLGYRENESGYYLICQGKRVEILSNGRIPSVLDLGISFFDTENKQLEEILFNTK